MVLFGMAMGLVLGGVAAYLVFYEKNRQIKKLDVTTWNQHNKIIELRDERDKLRLTVHDLEEVIIKSAKRMQEYDEAFQECQRLCEMLQEAKSAICPKNSN